MKVCLIAAISANGKIAEKIDQSSLDWTSKEDTRFFIEKTKELGTLVMGRKTFATIGKPLKDRRLIVMTRELSQEAAMPGVEFTAESPAELVRRLSSEGVTQLAVCGGASVYGQFLAAGLVTEMYLTVEPVLFGNGVPLATGFDQVALKFASSKMLNEHTILLHYTL